MIEGLAQDRQEELSFMHGIVQPDYTVGKFCGGEQLQPQIAAARRHQWNAFADELGNHMDQELVDLSFVEKRDCLQWPGRECS